MSYRKHGVRIESCFKETPLKDVETPIKIITLRLVLLFCVFDFYNIFCKYPCFSPILSAAEFDGRYLRLLQTFAGVLPCPLEKNSYARHFKGKHGKLYIVGKLNKCRFRKKYELPVFFNSTKENCKNDRQNDHASLS